MRAAQTDIRETFSFGTANGKQKSAEGGLERIITVLSRRRDVDKELMKEMEQANRELRKILEQQKELTKRTENIQDKKNLERSISEALRAGERCLHVIPGRGLRSGDRGAVLRNAAIQWLTHPPLSQHVLRQLQQAWIIAAQALSPLVQLMQQPSFVYSHLH
jgi:hypothetical protein